MTTYYETPFIEKKKVQTNFKDGVQIAWRWTDFYKNKFDKLGRIKKRKIKITSKNLGNDKNEKHLSRSSEYKYTNELLMLMVDHWDDNGTKKTAVKLFDYKFW